MLKKVTSLLISAVMVLASAQVKVFAQTLAQSAHEGSKPGTSDAQAKHPDLSADIGGLLAKSRVDNLTQSDMRRFEREGPNPQNTAKHYGAMTRKEKILIYSIVAGLVVLAVVLGIKTGKGGHTFCDTDPTDPECLGSF
jgi:flagellar biosynthesis/type III secretory pathway M-ring protein FliF/YscJ